MNKKKIFKKVIILIIILVILFIGWLFIGKAPQSRDVTWGVAFSQKQSEDLGIPWRDSYLAVLDDLKVSNLKLIAYWDLIEPNDDDYSFEDLDFQVEEARKRDVKIIFTVGRKVPRWPECHIPGWAAELDKEKQEEEVLEMIEKIIYRYNDEDSIWAWQVENEPFFNFGDCPDITEEFLKEEIDLVKLIDYKNRPIIISDSGSNRFWFKTARLGDIVSISLYRKVWFHELETYVEYPFPAVFYWRKARIVKSLFGKEVICGELQAEPWGPSLIQDLPIEKHKETMDLEKFQDNISFAKETGFDKFYLWGVEWWYWLKVEQNQPEIWEEAKKLFISSDN